MEEPHTGGNHFEFIKLDRNFHVHFRNENSSVSIVVCSGDSYR